MRRSSIAKIIFSVFVYMALYLSVLIGVRDYTKIFIAILAVGWHTLANLYCAFISSYRFKKSSAKYIEIKNKFIKKILVRPFSVYGTESTTKKDNTVNIIGLVLHIINIFIFVVGEVFILLPQISCKSYTFSLVVGGRPRNYRHLYFELDSLNQIFLAEAPRAFALVTALIFFVFVILYDRRLRKLRKNDKKKDKNAPPKKIFKNTKWHYPLYTSLIDISVRRNNKKHRFWYDIEQLKQIEDLVKSASENAELKFEIKRNKMVSFTVKDTLNDCVTFTGIFI